MVSDFKKYKDALFKEFDEYFSHYPLNVTDQLEQLDRWYDKTHSSYPYEKKALVYKAAAELCDVQVFRNSPFFFEIKSGRIRNSSQCGFPPGPGLEGWYMRKNASIPAEFQAWVKPYKDKDLIWAEIFSDFAHHTVGYDSLLEKGLKGISEDARQAMGRTSDARKISFYLSIISGCEALRHVAGKFADRAEEMLEKETDPGVRMNLEMIAKTARYIPFYPAETFYEALCAILFFKEMMTSLEGVAVAVLGHLDRLLYPFYANDIANGTLDYDQARNLLAHFLVITDARWDLINDNFASTNNSLVIGGCDAAGNIIWNDISRMIISLYGEFRFVNPKIQARITNKHPKEYFDAVSELVAKGNNVFSFLNDDVIIQANVKQGKKLEDARLYSAGGCQEPVLDNTEFNSRAFMYLSLPQLVNSCFDHTLDVFFDREKTGYAAPASYETFENLYQDFFRKLNIMFLRITDVLNEYGKRLTLYNPCPMLSSTITGCIEKGLDITEGGAVYNPTSIPLVGIGTAINSLLAIKEVVFDKKMMTFQQLGRLLAGNFADGPRMHKYLMNCCPKFGMDTPEVNAFSNRFFKDAAKATSGVPNDRGGMYEASLFVFYLFDWMKTHVGATADGRKAGTPLSRGMNPTEISGITNIANILHTVGALDMTDYPGTGVIYLEMPLTKGDILVEHISSVLHSFIKSGGSALDLNLLDPETLIKARENPDAYQKIIVRVCGFSAYFTSLDPHIQDEIIARTFVKNG
jgi:pyruvate-formate lyase